MMKHQPIFPDSQNPIVKTQATSSINQDVCMLELKPQTSIASTVLSHGHDETLSNISALIASLPNKVYENCQRTARVIMLSQLEKLIGKNKKLKQELSKNLQNFLPHNSQDLDAQGEYTTKTNYFKSLHYSRVRIGQRYFINKILHNPVFRQKFSTIFDQQTYENCQKARKNENSQVSFQKRKKVITSIIKQFKKSFIEFFNDYQQKNKNIIEEPFKQKEQSSAINIKMEEYKQPTNYIIQEEIDPRMCFFVMPIVPIPLSPLEYRYYQQTRHIYQ